MVMHCQEDKEKKSEKWKKKVLKATYQADPNVFEQEPAELHSDVDREEDTMFSHQTMQTKLSNARALTFSTGKIPPASCNASAAAPLSDSGNDAADNTPTVDGSDDESTDCNSQHEADHTDEEDNKAAEEHKAMEEPMLPVACGTKQPIDLTLEDAVVVPKIKKNLDGSCQRVKASDFDDVTKEILVTATSIFRCLIVTQAPFPDAIAVETKLAKEAWHEACQIKGVNVKLTPLAVKMLLSHTSHVRRELKTKMRSLTGPFFGFQASNSREIIRKNRDLADTLKDGLLFAFKDWVSKTGIYKTELLQLGINLMWFVN
ncbi:hypothetical protein DFH29DRAFT_876262 [Suillus ampliporus]|nr:hypothetical protein DFH29DRAFT_876262 [Suillus ampliporus]